MAYDEAYIVNRVDKDTHPLSVSSDGQRKLLPGAAYHVLNGRIITKGSVGSIGSIKGNQEIVNGNLPAGNNKVVGSFEDINDNTLIFFVYNDQGEHSIHRYYPSTNTFELIIQWAGLSFTGDPIKSIGLAGNNLYWADGNPRHIDLSNIDEYSIISDSKISVYKKPPTYSITWIKVTDSTVSTNRIQEDSYMFAFRYVYKDDSYSRLSPYSLRCFGNKQNVVANMVQLTIPVDSVQLNLIKKVEVFVNKNSETGWYLAETIDNVLENNTVKYYDDFKGFRLSDDEITSNESIAKEVKALAFFKDRLFMTNNKVGLDMDEVDLSFTLDLTNTPSTTIQLYFKENGTYSIGVKGTDKYGRNSLAKKIGTLTISDNLANTETISELGVNRSNKKSIRVRTSGTLPDWVDKYQIVMTPESNYSTYMQFPGMILFYAFDASQVPEGGDIPSELFKDPSDRYYYKEKQDDFDGLIHIKIPLNLPFVPEKDMYIRVKSADGYQVDRIIDYYGDRVVIADNFGKLDWSDEKCWHFFEIFTLSDSQEQLFYEINTPFSKTIFDPSDIGEDITVNGDTHISRILFKLGITYESTEDTEGYIDLAYREEAIENFYYVESPSSFIVNDKNTVSKIIDRPGDEFLWSINASTMISDYSKSSNHFGRVSALQKENGEYESPNQIAFSNTYIQDTFINGLHNFPSLNKKSIPNELSDIVALIPIGINIMLAVHERESSSITVGDGFIKTGDREGILVKTENVIGDERQLRGSMGTIFPGSVQSHEGRAYFYDIYKGCIVQYTVEGLFPISKYGMENYFKELSDKYLPYKDQINIVSGIDDFNDEYLISFPPVGELPGETWAFNYEEKTWTQHQYLPDYFGKIGNRLYSFKNGKLFEHNKTETHNNFYGVQYERSITIYANPKVRQNKRLLNAHLIIDSLPTDQEYKVLVIKTDNGQETYLKVKHFDNQENTFYASVMKDINTNVRSGLLAIKDGKDMRDKYFSVEIRSNSTNQNLFHSINLVFVDSPYVR